MAIPDFELFCQQVASLLEVAPGEVHGADYLLTDLGFDSMDMVELLALLAEHGVTDFPVQAEWDRLTVRTVYTDFLVGSLELNNGRVRPSK